MIHQLSPEQVDSLTAEHAPQIALSVAVANAHAARTPFSSIVAAVEHYLHDLLENIRIAEGGEAYRGRGAHSELERVVAMNALPTDTVENGRTYEIFERHKPRGSSPTERVDVRDVETGAVHLRVLADRFVDADLAADRSAGEGRA